MCAMCLEHTYSCLYRGDDAAEKCVAPLDGEDYFQNDTSQDTVHNIVDLFLSRNSYGQLGREFQFIPYSIQRSNICDIV